MKRYLIILLALLTLLGSCKKLKQIQLNKSIAENNKTIEKSLILEDVCNYVPDLKKTDHISSDFLIPLITKSDYYIRSNKAFSIVLCNIKDSTCYSQENFLFKTKYSNRNNFIVSMIFKKDVVFDTSHNVYNNGNYPIPNLHDFDFNLGFNKTDTIINGERYIYKNYKVPLDMEVYVQEAKHGNFWKIDADVYRPNTMDEWKHGYSKGIAISKKRNIIVYWFIVW
jgi:hypothetical protein